jgi:hypothetical protein
LTLPFPSEQLISVVSAALVLSYAIALTAAGLRRNAPDLPRRSACAPSASSARYRL